MKEKPGDQSQLLALRFHTRVPTIRGRELTLCRLPLRVSSQIAAAARATCSKQQSFLKRSLCPTLTFATYYRYVRDNSTVVLRYSTSTGVLETISHDEGNTWSTPINASQPTGKVKCGSAWPKMVGSDVVMACGGGSARSTDGGRTWTVSTKPIVYTGTNVTGGGEMMPVADGRTATSLTMMIRASSRNRCEQIMP